MAVAPQAPSPFVTPKDTQSATAAISISTGGKGQVVTKDVHPDVIPQVKEWGTPKTLVQGTYDQARSGSGAKAVLTYAGDGDTAKFDGLTRPDGNSVNCRISKIDAPETSHKDRYGKVSPEQPYAKEARRTLLDMIDKKEVTVRIIEPASSENHNREVCQIEVSGKDVSMEMIRAGAAMVYDRFASRIFDRGMYSAQREAKAAKRGLWAEANPENPADFRDRTK